MPVWIWCLRVYILKITFCFVFFFFSCTVWPSQSWTVYEYTIHGFHKFYFSVTFLLKMDLTALFTHLKIISLQYFQFQFSIFNFSKNKLNPNGFPVTLSSFSHSISNLFFLSNNHRDYQYLDRKTPNHQSRTHQRSTTHKSELKSHLRKKPPQPTNLLVETTTIASPPSLQSPSPQIKTINRNPTTADPWSQLPKSN